MSEVHIGATKQTALLTMTRILTEEITEVIAPSTTEATEAIILRAETSLVLHQKEKHNV